MGKLVWNVSSERFYETGVNQGVLYPRSGPGVAWNGLVSIEENVSGGETEAYYYDGIKYLDVVASEDFQATLTAFAAPPEFAECDGTLELAFGLYVTQQPRTQFGLCYRTLIGNALEGTDYGYKLHLVYNAMASPSSRSNQTIGDSVAPLNLSWELNTVPPLAGTYKPTAHLVIDSRTVAPAALAAIETVLYGSVGANPRLPLPSEILSLIVGPIIHRNLAVVREPAPNGTVTLATDVSWDGDIWSGVSTASSGNGVRLALNDMVTAIPNGAKIYAEWEIGNPNATAITVAIDAADNNVQTFVLAPGERRRILSVSTRATFGTTFRFTDLAVNTINKQALYREIVLDTSPVSGYFDDSTAPTVGHTYDADVIDNQFIAIERGYE